ncbi:MAG: IPT/TIG domain-containing protein, partial [Proteobacteria bacterium]|nr:IPT/TIG domain-containing protein [Pseudomonadota bacterium]
VADNCGTCDSNPSNDCVQDCAGTWGGNAVADNCGTCDSNPSNDCVQDCAGTWGGNAVADNCGTCDSNPSNDCVQDCAGAWGGDAVADNCGTCDSNPNNDCVQDCAGAWGGNAVADNCGTCDSDPTNDCTVDENDKCFDLSWRSCKKTAGCSWDRSLHECVSDVPVQDCNGDLGGSAYSDNCGNCVGGNTGLTACVQDCAGTWGGDAVVDKCGVCDANPANDCSNPPVDPPYIRRLDDNDGKPGYVEKIKGYRFGRHQDDSYVLFGSVKVRIKEWNDDVIKYYIPNLRKGDYPVSVWVNGAQSNVKWFELKD